MYQATKPGGGLLITVPQHKWMWSDADVAAHHVKRYTRRELREEISAAGFTMVRVASFVSLLLPAMMASRMLKKDPGNVEEELDMAAPINKACYSAMQLEGALIRAGLNFPAGGSLLAVAKRPS
jgi:hypothetical protein